MKRGHNKKFYQNHELIKAEYLRILKTERRMPSQIEVAKNIGLTQTTISMHLNDLDLSELIDPFKFYGDSVLISLMEKAEGGSEPAAKLFFNIIYDWAERKELKADVNANVEVKAESELTLSDKKAKLIADILALEDEVAAVIKTDQRKLSSDGSVKAEKKHGKKAV
jgi:DNA-binding Lrp family transcriptional regulator